MSPRMFYRYCNFLVLNYLSVCSHSSQYPSLIILSFHDISNTRIYPHLRGIMIPVCHMSFTEKCFHRRSGYQAVISSLTKFTTLLDEVPLLSMHNVLKMSSTSGLTNVLRNVLGSDISKQLLFASTGCDTISRIRYGKVKCDPEVDKGRPDCGWPFADMM